jgi:hypothetical protein
LSVLYNIARADRGQSCTAIGGIVHRSSRIVKG